MSSELAREIKEDLEREKIQNIIKRYGVYVAGLVTFVLLFVIISNVYKSYKESNIYDQAAIYSKAVDSMQAGKLDEAINNFNAIIDADVGGYSTLASLNLASIQLTSKDYQKAEEELKQLDTLTSTDNFLKQAIAVNTLAYVQILNGNSDQAISTLQAINSENNPDLKALAEERIALIHLEKGEGDKAIEVYKSIAENLATPPSIRVRAEQAIIHLAK